MSVNDRGAKKWTAMMLPEHVEALKQIFAEEHKERPILDEQQMEENGFILRNASKGNLIVQIKYYTNNDFHIIEGKIYSIDLSAGICRIGDKKIRLKDVIGIYI